LHSRGDFVAVGKDAERTGSENGETTQIAEKRRGKRKPLGFPLCYTKGKDESKKRHAV